jgi:ethanolamine kinase
LPEGGIETVSFIDYEYATPSPAALDIANHFAEWGGFECDYNALPSRSQRLCFLREYLQSYQNHLGQPQVSEEDVQKLFKEVDMFRGVPGFYW